MCSARQIKLLPNNDKMSGLSVGGSGSKGGFGVRYRNWMNTRKTNLRNEQLKRGQLTNAVDASRHMGGILHVVNSAQVGIDKYVQVPQQIIQ